MRGARGGILPAAGGRAEAMTEFPPGSIGAQKQGCTCEDEVLRDMACPLHGAAVEFQRVFSMFEEAHEAAWQERKDKARGRIVRGLPVVILLQALPVALSIVFPMWVAECILWGLILGALLVAWAYRG
jgi:hypothetical protein